MTTIEDPRGPAVVQDGQRRERVLLLADGGIAGIAATRWLAERATTVPLAVEVLEVLDDDAHRSGRAPTPDGEAGPALDHMLDLLGQLAPHVVLHGDVRTGDPVRTAVELAADADLVVVGSNRADGLLPHVSPSFATRVAAACGRPVVAVPRGWEHSPGPVVVGVQDDASDVRALEFAAAAAERTGRELVVAHTWQVVALAAPTPEIELRPGAAERAGVALVDRVVDRLRGTHPGLRVGRLLRHETPTRLLKQASAGASLLVVGTHGVKEIDPPLHRSVSREVLERPWGPIVVVPPTP